ncbi:lytic transglycosylase domain-containing protein [Pajaroellobacter abortibovis]|nr:lytic transglycosylase domain-containing protein [Pajaroellobacter abortibovis]
MFFGCAVISGSAASEQAKGARGMEVRARVHESQNKGRKPLPVKKGGPPSSPGVLAVPFSSLAAPKKSFPPVPSHASKPDTKGKQGVAKEQQGVVRPVDTYVCREVASVPPSHEEEKFGVESPELRSLREAEREMFPPAAAPPGFPWPSEISIPQGAQWPRLESRGAPPFLDLKDSLWSSKAGKDRSWLRKLRVPSLPVQWDPRVIRYLEFYRYDPRGRTVFANLFQRAGRYRDLIQRALRRRNLPEDLMWLAMIESGFDPLARSPAGAVGLWQFSKQTAKSYGLACNRWVDERLNVVLSTEVALDFLTDLQKRFGLWELAFAAYNMGYVGMTQVIRKYNTNDFWMLSRLEGALPWETALYVPKIIATAIVAHNVDTFGYSALRMEPPVLADLISVPLATPLQSIAAGAGCTVKEIRHLNPQILTNRVPPVSSGNVDFYMMRVPVGRGDRVARHLASLPSSRYLLEVYTVRLGESLEQIAEDRKIPLSTLMELNGIAPGGVVRSGDTLIVPRRSVTSSPFPFHPVSSPKATVVVPPDVFIYPDRKRVFYRVLVGDVPQTIAEAFGVSLEDLWRWNRLDPSACLQEGMTLQLFVHPTVDLSRVRFLQEQEVDVIANNTEEFFAHFEGKKSRKRIGVRAKPQETIAMIGKRYGLSPGSMERINHRSRSERLKGGEIVIVYVPTSKKGDPPLKVNVLGGSYSNE